MFHSLRIYPYPMVWPLPRPWSSDHGLDPPLNAESLEIKGFSGSGAPIFWIWSCRPRAQGVGVDPFLLNVE